MLLSWDFSGSALIVTGFSEGVPSAPNIPDFKDEAGASPVSGWAVVAMFVVGKRWLFSQGISQLKHRDLHTVWAPQAGAAGYGAVQPAMELCSWV